MTAKPKTSRRSVLVKDVPATGLLPNESITDKIEAKYKNHPNSGYWGYADKRLWNFERGDDVIKGRVEASVSVTDLHTFLKWLEDNTISDTTKITVSSVFFRTLTDDQRASIDATDAKKSERQAREKAARAAAAKKAKEAEKKREEERRKREEAYAKEREGGDLAHALKVLKKHGLKIVSVSESK
jgi:hypothetical protein